MMTPAKKQEVQQIQMLLDEISRIRRIEETSITWNPRGHATWSDAEIRIKPKKGPGVVLLVEAKSRPLFPRDIRDLLWSMREEKRFLVPDAPIAVLAAYSLSQGAKEVLRENDVGYYDSGGSLFIPGDSFYIQIDKPEPKPVEKKNRAMFKGKRAQVVHALLQNHGKWVSVKDIAETSNVSPAMTSETLSTLDLSDWISSRGNGPSKERCLQKPGELLNAWAAQNKSVRPPAYRRYYVPRTSTEELARNIATVCSNLKMTYALTGEFAAQHYMPYLTTISTLKCKVRPGRADELAQLLSAQPVAEGANLQIMESRDEVDFQFSTFMDQVCLASAVLVYLDLLSAPGRGAEMAEHLRQEVLRY